jgi:ubiquitin-conjugating enzyme E2 N
MSKKRILKEMAILHKNPIDRVVFKFDDDNIYLMTCVITGAEDTPYEGGEYHVAIQLPKDYPTNPPKVILMTKIYHPNINTIGKVCLNIIKEKEWLPGYRIETIIRAIQALMSCPNTKDPLNNEAAALWDADIDEARAKAKYWCEMYAKPAKKDATLITKV